LLNFIHCFLIELIFVHSSISFNTPATGSKLNGKVLHSQSREIVTNVYKYMKEAGPTITVKNKGVEVAKATNGCIGK
jgi:hypothetical protein